MKTLKNNKRYENLSITNNVIFKAILLVLGIIMLGCNNDDDKVATNKDLVIGKWQVDSGNLLTSGTKYIYINNDNTINILTEDELGFKGEVSTKVSLTDDQITITLEGPFIVKYTFKDDILTLQPPTAGAIVLSRAVSPPDVTNWVKELSILEEGAAPWSDTRDIDIAYDGTYILGGDVNDRKIFKVNPTNFNIEGIIPTIHAASSVEIEKSDASLKQLFQSDGGRKVFLSYIYSSNTMFYESIDLGRWIIGLASVEPGYLWVASQSESKLYLYKSNGSLTPGEVVHEIPLDFKPLGLDYQDGYLYVSDRERIHKCQTIGGFKAIESYKLPNHEIHGVAFDSSSFWLNTYNHNEGKVKLVKTNL
ncbi:hypothetical protein Q4Q34_10660 [Flavivirga abyssicola]|uniref:YncE family protein n=1 Tax=Flavivirga abyssicola TaxID=3063533 RepID=UPI0026E0DFF1|nr:hypothetical protein [Flavivirga sp. MEBiC07777]WVK11686.1 hypothetical protein Q4Q34_10660 [Flavivirga sp. MEBiC07777]